MRIRTALVAMILAATVAQVSSAAIPLLERDALVALYEATGGEQWIDRDDWLGPLGSECAWYGVYCNPAQTTVEKLVLRANHLDGTLPPEIGQLSGLSELDLSMNQIRASVPASIGNLTELVRLDLSDNELELPLPSSLFALPGLEVLRLAGNRFTGAVPSELGSLTSLTVLDLSSNGFFGEIPAAITSLNSLSAGQSDFSYNSLRTDSTVIRDFVAAKQIGGDWEETQTVPPTGLGSDQDRGIIWIPIEYTDDRGTYRISVAPKDGGEPVVFATGSKSSSSFKLEVTDIVGELLVTIRTITEPHGRQKNTLVSEASEPLEYTLFGYAPDFPFFTVGARPEPLVQIGGVPQNETFLTVVNYGGLGAEAQLERSGEFFAIGENEFFVDAFSTVKVDVSSLSQPPGEYGGGIVVKGDGAPESGITVPIILISLPAPPDAEGRPEKRRLDLVSGRSPMTSSTRFTNHGAETLSGVVESDVPWIVPVSGMLTIAPGESKVIEFTIDPDEFPDRFSRKGVSFSGALRLVYPDEAPVAGKGVVGRNGSSTEISTTLATIVNTVPPEVTNATIPDLGNGERAFFAPGLLDGSSGTGEVFTDLSIANSFGSVTIDDLRAFFSGIGTSGAAERATFDELRRRAALLLGSPVDTVFSRPGTSGTIQVRSTAADSLLVSARLLSERNELGLLGTALPVFSSDRSAGPGESIYLPGLSGASRVDLFVQSTTETGAEVTVDLLDSSGDLVSSIGPVEIEGWGVVELDDIVRDGGVTAIVRNESDSGAMVAHALARDETSGDFWVIVDWSSYWGESRRTPMILPIAKHEGPAPAAVGRRRAVVRPGAEEPAGTGLDVSLFNLGRVRSAAKLLFHDVDGSVAESVVVLAPRETRTITDLLASIFDRAGVVEGYVRFIPLRGEIALAARIVTTGRIDGTVGSTVPAHPRGAGIRLGQRRSIAAVDDSRRNTVEARIGATWRTRISLLETSGRPATVRATMRIPTGQSLAAATVSRRFQVGSNQLLRLGTIAQAIMGEERQSGVDDLHDLQIEFYLENGDGSVIVVTEMVENATGDAIIRFD